MIGGIIWIYDINLRHYAEGSHGPPIYRKSFREHHIVGETRVSWIDKRGTKIPKRGGRGICFSQEEIDQDVFRHDNAYKISQKVQYLGYEKLKQVADLIGYEEKE